MDPTQSAMPMGQAAKLPLDMGDVMAQMPIQKPLPPTAPVPPAAAGMQQLPNAQPSAPAGPPYASRVQSDGSIVVELPPATPDGQPIVIATYPAPKLPAALQPRA